MQEQTHRKTLRAISFFIAGSFSFIVIITFLSFGNIGIEPALSQINTSVNTEVSAFNYEQDNTEPVKYGERSVSEIDSSLEGTGSGVMVTSDTNTISPELLQKVESVPQTSLTKEEVEVIYQNVFEVHKESAETKEGTSTPVNTETIRPSLDAPVLPVKPDIQINSPQPIPTPRVETETHFIAEECKKLGATTRAECEKLFSIAYLPEACRKEHITTPEACDKFLLGKVSRPVECRYVSDTGCRKLVEEGVVESKNLKEIISDNVPPFCREEGATTINACEKIKEHRLLPALCRERGATTPAQCATLFKALELPNGCKVAGIKTESACKTFLLAHEDEAAVANEIPSVPPEFKTLPKKCELLGITDRDVCKKVIKETEVPKICRETGITNRESCAEFLKTKLLPAFCQNEASGEGLSTTTDACEVKLKKEIKEEVRCVGIAEADCEEIALKHSGFYLNIREKAQEIKEQVKPFLASSVMSREKLPQPLLELVKESIVNDRPLRFHPAKGGVVITEGEDVTSVPPAILFPDDDGDGIPNDAEERIGTNPKLADTDGDGFDDKLELKNGFSPLGEGRETRGHWAIDGAVIFDLPLEQPIASEAEVGESFVINAPQNVESTNNNTGKGAGTEFSGKAEPNTLITLYVYSALPMVLSVETDSSGNWNYVLKDSLADGEHKVYIALVDELGNINKKSEPLSFFVEEAKAVSPAEFLNFETPPITISEAPASELTMYYLIGSVFLVVIGLAIVVIILLNTRKKAQDTENSNTPT